MKIEVRPGVVVDIGEPEWKPLSPEKRAKLWVLLAPWREQLRPKHLERARELLRAGEVRDGDRLRPLTAEERAWLVAFIRRPETP